MTESLYERLGGEPRIAAIVDDALDRHAANPLVAPRFLQWLPHGLHPLIESGILLASISAVVLNLYFNGGKADASAAIEAAKTADAH